MILCLFFCEFDHLAGPVVTFQAPSDFPSKELFSKVSDYVITVPELCNRLITLTAMKMGHRILGFPVRMKNKKYERNVLQFSFGIILAKETRSYPYENVLRKLSFYFQTLEQESEFLFKTETKRTLKHIIDKIYYELNEFGECNYTVDKANKIQLKLFPKMEPPDDVHDHQVPVQIQNLEELAGDEWDLALKRIIPFIDGVNYVDRIARLSDTDVQIVRRCMKQLLYFGFVTMIDIFLYSNEYELTAKMTEFLSNEALKEECVVFVQSNKNRETPSFQQILLIFTKFRRGVRVSQICMKTGLIDSNIDVRRLITFGLVNKILRRVHKYPIICVDPAKLKPKMKNKKRYPGGETDESDVPESEEDVEEPGVVPPTPEVVDMMKCFDGDHCTDEIACKSGESDVQSLVQRNKAVKIIGK